MSPRKRDPRAEYARRKARATSAAYPVVGIVEIAARLDRSRSTVEGWLQRSSVTGFPEPDYIVGGRPAWVWTTVERWAHDTGRS